MAGSPRGVVPGCKTSGGGERGAGTERRQEKERGAVKRRRWQEAGRQYELDDVQPTRIFPPFGLSAGSFRSIEPATRARALAHLLSGRPARPSRRSSGARSVARNESADCVSDEKASHLHIALTHSASPSRISAPLAFARNSPSLRPNPVGGLSFAVPHPRRHPPPRPLSSLGGLAPDG